MNESILLQSPVKDPFDQPCSYTLTAINEKLLGSSRAAGKMLLLCNLIY